MSKAPKQKDAGEQLALPGVPLEQRLAVWREHTAERWQDCDPDAYAQCVEAIKNGEVNGVRLSKRFRVSRNTIQALKMREFSVEQLQTINAKRAAIAAGEALDKAEEVTEHATKRELGALAMLAKSAFEIGQLGSGGATSRHEERHIYSVEDFAREVGPGTGLEAGKIAALPPGGSGGAALGEGSAGDLVPAAMEAELVALSNGQALSKEDVRRSESTMLPAIVLLFVPVLAWLVGGTAWGMAVGGTDALGFLNRGGGGQVRGFAPEPLISSATGNFLALPAAGMPPRFLPCGREGC